MCNSQSMGHSDQLLGQATDLSLHISPACDKSKSITTEISSFWNLYCKHLSASAVKSHDIHGAVLSESLRKTPFGD